MADWQADARHLAERFVDYVLTSVDTPLPSDAAVRRSVVVPRAQIVTADVGRSVEHFAQTVRVARYALDGQVPTVETSSGPIAIDLTAVAEAAAFSADAMLTSVRHLLATGLFGRTVVPLRSESAIEVFGRQLTAFLFTRFEASSKDDSERPGRVFEVTTDTDGLRVHYSTAFVLEWDVVFGAPTNPVRSWLQPGDYYFGATGPGVSLSFDTSAKYEIPRVSRAHLRI